MFVVADVDTMRAVGRAVLGEAEQIGALSVVVDSGAVGGAAIAAAVDRAQARIATALDDLERQFSATGRSVELSAIGYADVDSANAALLEGVERGGS